MFLQEEIAGRMQVSIMSKYSVLCMIFFGLCVIWCALVLCVMVCTCWFHAAGGRGGKIGCRKLTRH